MKIAINKTKSEKTTPLQEEIKKKSSAKRTYQIKSAVYFQISPPDGTQYAIISAERRSENEARKSDY